MSVRQAGYAIASLSELDWNGGKSPAGRESPGQVTLTSDLGCTHTGVDAYRLPGGGSFDLPSEGEQVVVPLDETRLVLGESRSVPSDGVGRVPAGVTCSVSAPTSDGANDADATFVFVVSAPAESTSEDEPEPTVLSLADCAFEHPGTSDVVTARLTRRLGCVGMKLNARLLEPGQVVPYHTEGDQEELFLPVEGPATMRIADETYETPPGTVVRVAPEVPRSALNDGESDAYWVIVGAPPTGGPDEWDPGAEILG